MEKGVLVKFAGWTGIPLIFGIIIILIPFIINFTFSNNDYFMSFKKFKLVNQKIDSLVVMTRDGGTTSVWGITKINKKIIEISHGSHFTQSSDSPIDPIIDLHRKQNKYLDIWYWEESDQAYFVEPGLEEMTFKTVWLPDLKRLSIVLVIYLFHAYCQRVRKKYETENPNFDEYTA